MEARKCNLKSVSEADLLAGYNRRRAKCGKKEYRKNAVQAIPQESRGTCSVQPNNFLMYFRC